MNILRPFSPHLPRFRRLFYSFLFLFALLGVFYWISVLLSSFDLFQDLLKRVVLSLGTRSVSTSLVKMGCSGGLTLAIVFAMKTLLTSDMEDAKMMMDPSGSSGASSSGATGGNEASSSSVGASSGASSGVDQASSSREKSALDQRKDELILENLKERKGDVGDGQRISDVRKTLENDFNVKNKGNEWEFLRQMEKERGAIKEECHLYDTSASSSPREYHSPLMLL